MVTRFTNKDGLVETYGTRGQSDDGVLGRKVGDESAVQQLRYEFSYNALPGFDKDADGGTTVDSFSNACVAIPAGSVIVNCYLTAKTAWTGTATVDFGLYKQDGTVIDQDGLITAIDVDDVSVGLGVKGISQRAAGVCVQNTSGTFDPDWADTGSVTNVDYYIKATNVGGTLTAGTAVLVVEYVPL